MFKNILKSFLQVNEEQKNQVERNSSINYNVPATKLEIDSKELNDIYNYFVQNENIRVFPKKWEDVIPSHKLNDYYKRNKLSNSINSLRKELQNSKNGYYIVSNIWNDSNKKGGYIYTSDKQYIERYCEHLNKKGESLLSKSERLRSDFDIYKFT